MFPSLQHVNVPVEHILNKKTPLSLTAAATVPASHINMAAVSKMPLPDRESTCGEAFWRQYSVDSESGGDSGDDTGLVRSTLYDRSSRHEGDCFDTPLDFRGLWVTYITAKYLHHPTNGIANSKKNSHDMIDLSKPEEDSFTEEKFLTFGGLEASVNNYLKEMNVVTIKKFQALKSAQLQAVQDRQQSDQSNSILQYLPPSLSVVKGSLAAAQVNILRLILVVSVTVVRSGI